MKLSKTEQDYIKAIYEYQTRNKQQLVSLKQLVTKMNVSAPTVTEMVKRIEKKKLIVYQSYKGVYLTEYGLKEAIFILKAHRVWEYFLLDVLKYQEEDVHEEAEALEHAATPMLIEKLYAYLGKPEKCPHGQEIPQEVFWHKTKKVISLDKLDLNLRAEFESISQELLAYFKKISIKEQPTFIKVDEILDDMTMIAKIDNNQRVIIPNFFQKNTSVIVYE